MFLSGMHFNVLHRVSTFILLMFQNHNTLSVLEARGHSVFQFNQSALLLHTNIDQQEMVMDTDDAHLKE